MIDSRPKEPPAGFPKGAFTLIEIIVAMTIIAVIAAVAVPVLKGLHEDEKAREPLTALAAMVQEVRTRAMREHRPYEIIFEREGLHAIPGNRAFAGRDEFLKHLEELRTPPPVTEFEQQKVEVAGTDAGEGAAVPGLDAAPGQAETEGHPAAGEVKPPELPWNQTIVLTEEMKSEILMWGDGEWEAVEGEGMRRWVFQANGMASPAGVRLIVGGTELEGHFDILTGEMTRERSRPQSTRK